MENQVKSQLKNFKMKKVIFALLFCSLVILIRSTITHQSLNRGIERAQNVKKDNFRLAKFNSLLWSPSDITVTFRKSVSNQTELIEGRAKSEKMPIVVNQQLTAALNSATKKSRSIESFERKHHSKHSGN